MKTFEQKLFKGLVIATVIISSITIILFSIALLRDDDETAVINNTKEQHINVTAKALYKDYNENVAYADELYKGKLLQVTGRVAGISNDLSNGYYLKLETDNEFLPISCHFESNAELKDLKIGSLVVVKGRCKGEVIYIYIDDCVIMK